MEQQRLMFVGNPAELRKPVRFGTLGDFKGVHGRFIWVHFDGTDEAQTVLPEELQNFYLAPLPR